MESKLAACPVVQRPGAGTCPSRRNFEFVMVFDRDDSYIEHMKRNNITLACLLAGVVVAVQTAPAITADNPYTSVITGRNLFSLKPPTAPEDPTTKLPPPPVPKVWLTGISTIMGGKRAFLRLPVPARGTAAAGEVSLYMAENDAMQEGIQVLEIDIASGRVKINNNGTFQTLDIAKDSPAMKSAAPPPVAAPGVGAPRPIAAVAPAAQPSAGVSVGRPLRVPGSGPDPNAGNVPPNTAANAGTRPRQALSLEDQTIMIEANRMATQHLVDQGELPPLPPTDLTDILKQEQEAANQPPGPR